jgi:hypothetical protein
MSYTWGYIKDASLAKLDLSEEEANTQGLISRFPFYANEVITQICSSIKPKYAYVSFEITNDEIGVPQVMPEDFVSFGDDVCFEYKEKNIGNNKVTETVELYDEDYEYYEYNKVVFNRPGKFFISYNARWFTFDKNIDNNLVLEIPYDILECIPSYIASQCFKIDDEYKASVFRNEYEMMLARIDNSNYKNTKTFSITGGW